MAVLAHISDLHATAVHVRRPLDFLGQRMLGLLSFRLRRSRVHRPEPLAALARDLAELAPAPVAVTGDLTNVSTLEEFEEARGWLVRLGGPERVCVVPGNHDAYVAIPRDRTWALWDDYLRSDDTTGPAVFPTLRVRPPFALIGVSSALPTAPLRATGRVGPAQLVALEKRLTELADTPLCRVVLIHHPVVEGTVSSRRALSDAAALREVLARAGAELVLHGHGHRTVFASVPGPDGEIPVVGVRSASDATDRPDKSAQYHLYEAEPRSGPGPRFSLRAHIRAWDPEGQGFRPAGDRTLV